MLLDGKVAETIFRAAGPAWFFQNLLVRPDQWAIARIKGQDDATREVRSALLRAKLASP